ncbi:Oidioi.mRNA.OKI2018_I69.XSR.g14823.t1.cds [Oikopleura dioica]|uniref:Oidioi.mRNA.OKI2018_I69.XSR.g14823.t1.cds n=1 Tax=Oikopleura dioica TaxID=34765 RepID=A0ABN7SBF2_OIKDI|nr:Oidioi.mRNA.OKI2018_I69.XSR.g14823.t1.cds [Oikopleura dioica]
MYKRAYVRFATTKFNLDSLDAQVHLTNNAIQKNYSIDADVQDAVPEEKMWFSEELDEYLRSLGHGNAYQEKIYEDMKNILIESCLSSQENSTHRKNSFEVYGADFMLDEKLNVWLIEINQGPTMSTATKVSDELVGEMLEDMCKVVVDRRARGGRNADTGNFVQVYRQGNADPPPFTGTALSVEGKQIPIVKKDKDANENEEGEEQDQAFEQRVYSWDHDRIERLAQPRHVKKRRDDVDQKRIEMRLKKPNSGKVESPKPIMTITSQTTVVQRKSCQNQSTSHQTTNKVITRASHSDTSASTCSSSTRNHEEQRLPKKANTRSRRPPPKSAANEYQQQKTSGHKVQIDPSMSSEIKNFFRPTSSRSEYVPTQSEYRLAQKEIAADVMHTLDEHRIRNAPSIRYSSSNPVIPSRTTPRKTPRERQSNCVEQKILYPLRFTEKRYKNPQQSPNKKDYWKYQLSSSSTQAIDGREVTRDLIRAKTTLSKASLFRPVYALDTNNKVIIGDQSLAQLPVIMPLRCSQRGRAVQTERIFSAAITTDNQADNVPMRGEVRKGIPDKTARVHKAKPYCIKIPLSLAPRHYHPSAT